MADIHQRVILDDGTGVTPPTAALGSAANPINDNLASVAGAAISAANGIPIYDGFQAPQAATWTNGTALNTTLTLATAGYDTVVVTVSCAAGISGGVLVWEVFDGVNWIPIKGFRTDSYLSDQSIALSASLLKAWQLSVAGFPQTRVRLSTVIAGAGNVGIAAIVSSAPDVSGVTVGLDPNSPLPAGTNLLGSANVAASAAAGFSKSRLVALGTTNATNVKASAATLAGFSIINVAGAARFVKFYDLASAPVVGTSAIALTVELLATTQVSQFFGDAGIAFTAGLGYSTTQFIADSDTTAIAAGDIIMTLFWK